MLAEGGQENNETKDETGDDQRATNTEETNKTPGKSEGKPLEKQRILPIKSKKSKTKKYSVQKGPKLSKHNSTEDTGITQPTVFDPLAEKIDWDRPVENDIPHLLPYKRDDSNLKSVQEALVKKFTEEQKISEQNTKEVKKGRKMKGKGKPKKNSKKSSSDPKTKEKSKDKDKKKKGQITRKWCCETNEQPRNYKDKCTRSTRTRFH